MKILVVASVFAVSLVSSCKPVSSEVSGATQKPSLASAPSISTSASSDFELVEDADPDSDFK